jgi:carboxylesterase type B
MTGLANGPTLLHEEGTSNVALWDVQHAFEWTKKYISAFGGSPEKITAVGFSAGGSQTLFQLTVSLNRVAELCADALSDLPAVLNSFSIERM